MIDPNRIDKAEECVSIARSKGFRSIMDLRNLLEKEGFIIIDQNAWAITFYDGNVPMREANQLFISISSGLDKDALKNPKVMYKYNLKSYFTIRESINNPYDVPAIIVSNPTILEKEYYYGFVRSTSENSDTAPAILCGDRPDRGEVSNLDYIVLEPTGYKTIINPNEYKNKYPVYLKLGNVKDEVELVQRLPIMFFKGKTTAHTFKAISVKSTARRFLWGEPYNMRMGINSRIRGLTAEAAKREAAKEISAATVTNDKGYTIRKMVVTPNQAMGIRVAYVVFNGPREGLIICDESNLRYVLNTYNDVTGKYISIEDIFSRLNSVGKVEMLAGYGNAKTLPEDKNIPQKIYGESNRELAYKIGHNLIIT